MTNGDRIRKMTDEELANFLVNIREPEDDELVIEDEQFFAEEEIYNWLRKRVSSKQKVYFEWIAPDIIPINYGYILLSFANFSIPCVGRYEEDENGGAYYIGDEDESCVQQGMIVNGWMPLPECYNEIEI